MPKKLTEEEARIIIDKGTEPPFSGEFDKHFQNGLYLCRQCDSPLYRSYDKFNSGCGWPSFDDELPGAIRKEVDKDGRRIEILCQQCGGHLGHVFQGEKITKKDTRHCVNSLSMQFVSIDTLSETDNARFGLAYFAAGCFWGVEKRFIELAGVLATQVGYSGGHLEHPSYQSVCRGDSGHAETVKVIYDTQQLSYTELLTHFFSTHDATQLNRQGVDHGHQYRSVIFYVTEAQKTMAETAIEALMNDGVPVQTELTAATTFWPAEESHQHYHK